MQAIHFLFRYCIALLLFASPYFLLAQDPVAVNYSNQLSTDSVYHTISVLSYDSLEGRETGRPGQKKAAAFIRSAFKRNGLLPGVFGTYDQFHPVTARSCDNCSVEVNQQFFVFMRDYFYASGYSDTMLVIDSVHFVGYGISDPAYDDYKNQNLFGKTIMFCDGEPRKKSGKYFLTKEKAQSDWSNDWKKKVDLIYEKKPRLVFIITDSLEAIADSFNYKTIDPGFMRLVKGPGAIPIMFITKAMALRFFPETNDDMLSEAISKITRKRKPVSLVQSANAVITISNNTDRLKGQNIIAYVEGYEKKEEAVFVTAHYDHLGNHDSLIYHGADDNASGTSAVVEMARVFSKAAKDGHRPRRSIYFMLVSGEEKGLLGSKYYVKRPVVPLQNTVVDLNTDMIGRVDDKHDSLTEKNYVYIIGSDKLSSELHEINERINKNITHLTLDYTYNKPGDPNRFYFRSDHYNFAKNNVPVIFYFNGTHQDYHRETDTIDKIDTSLLINRARLVFLTAWEVANRNDRIRVDTKPEKE